MAMTISGKLGGNIAPSTKLRAKAQVMKNGGAIKAKKPTSQAQKNANSLGAVAGRRPGGSISKPRSTGKL